MVVKLYRYAPKTIQFEGLSRCNAHCTFCPITGDMTRGRGEMSEELFHKIIKEGKELGVEIFVPYFCGEPFLDNKIFRWMDYMEEQDVRFCLFTNAVLLDKEKIDKLVQYKKLQYIVCSINAATKEMHEKVMRLPPGSFDKVIANVRYLKDKAPFKVDVSFAVVKENEHEIGAFKKMFRGYRRRILPFMNWAGTIHNPIEKTGKQVPCFHLRSMDVLWDGRVCFCCYDFDGKVILGDLNTQSVKEVWDRGRIFRRRHGNFDFDMELCRHCNVNTELSEYVFKDEVKQ